jgi:N-acetyl-gamma-glutamyl-phosphate reductase
VRVRESVTPEQVRALYAEAFRGEPFVRVPAKRLPEVAAVAGSNFAEVSVEIGPPFGGTRVVTVFSVTDNLIKGGAGQAIQSMNLMLGLDERTTLEDTGPWP